MDGPTKSSSTLRLRRKTRAVGDANSIARKNGSSTRKDPEKEIDASREENVNISKGKRERIRTSRKRQKEDGSLQYLVATTAVLFLLVIGGFLLIVHLLFQKDPALLENLPHLQKFVNTSQSILSWWRNQETNSWKSTLGLESDENQHWKEPAPLPPSAIYTIPNSMGHIGDKSDEYARLRKDWDERYPPNSPKRSLAALQDLFSTDNSLSSIYRRMVPPPLQSKPNEDDTSLDEDAKKDWDYDIYNCPDDPPPGYPREYKTIDILKHWPPTQNLPMGKYCYRLNATSGVESDDTLDASCDSATSQLAMAHLGLCVFDYTRDYEKAIRYRSKELPIVVRNDPRVAETVERWNDETYRRQLFGGLHHSHTANTTDNPAEASSRRVIHRAERSITNQVLFRHSQKKKAKKSTYPFTKVEDTKEPLEESPPMPPPTKLVSMTYDRWYELARLKEGNLTMDVETGIKYYDPNRREKPDSYYYYFRLVGCGEKDGCEKNATEFLFDEMPFFQPRRYGHRRNNQNTEATNSSIMEQDNLYLVQPEKQRGIHCRFGMPGILAANHYDASRNAIAVLGGSRRYIISRPEQCPNMGLYPIGHPSARHSRVDWTTASEDYRKMLESDDLFGSSSEDSSWVKYRKDLTRLANNATSTEVILQAGDVLYLPSYWFHFIISLDTNMQCNTRSGRDGKDDHIMTQCGFPPPKHGK